MVWLARRAHPGGIRRVPSTQLSKLDWGVRIADGSPVGAHGHTTGFQRKQESQVLGG